MLRRNLGWIVLVVALASVLSACSALLGVDFGSFKSPDAGASPDGPVCKTCQDLGAECGIQDDGCGNTLDCGQTCPNNGTCVGLKCHCPAKSCVDLGTECGNVNDGCGGSLDCGQCAAGLSCVNNACKCVAKTCADYGNPECGTYPTGCGTDTINCGAGCAGGGKPYCSNGICTTTPCTAKTCSDVGNPCDTLPDGCGGVVGPCVTCNSPQSCGGGGTAHQCGCTAKTCNQVGNPCDAVSDGCGGSVGPCTSCTLPQTCGGGMAAHQCGCTPSGACPVNANCGTVPDGCGGNLSCGPNCLLPDTCGGGGKANVCGCTSNGSCSNCCGAGFDNCGLACSGATCCGGGCFPGGTLVLMADGTERGIETLHAGDAIMTVDPATRLLAPDRIANVASHGPETSQDGLLLINDRLRVTPNHPMVTPSGGTVNAGKLSVGDEIVFVPNATARPYTESVRTIVKIPGNVPVYTLTMSNGSVFIVDHTVAAQKL